MGEGWPGREGEGGGRRSGGAACGIADKRGGEMEEQRTILNIIVNFELKEEMIHYSEEKLDILDYLLSLLELGNDTLFCVENCLYRTMYYLSWLI